MIVIREATERTICDGPATHKCRKVPVPPSITVEQLPLTEEGQTSSRYFGPEQVAVYENGLLINGELGMSGESTVTIIDVLTLEDTTKLTNIQGTLKHFDDQYIYTSIESGGRVELFKYSRD